MKKKLSIFLASMILMTSMAGVASANKIVPVSKSNIEVLLDARKISFPDAKPILDSNKRVLVPIRFVSEALGGKVDWNGGKGVAIQKDNQKIELTIGSSKAKVNGDTKMFDTTMQIKQQRTYVPLRFISEALGETVEWDQGGQWVWIGSKRAPSPDDAQVAMKKVSDIKHLFKRGESFLVNTKDQPYKHAYIIDRKQLPVKYEGITVHDIQVVKDDTGNQAIKLRFEDSMFSTFSAPPMFYLTDKRTRVRYAVKNIEHKDASGKYVAYYKVVSKTDNYPDNDPTYKQFKVGDVKYFGLYLGGDNMFLIKNPF